MATLKELADRTGYAPATISRILSGDPTLSVTPEARRIVLEEAGRLNYTATRSRRGRTPKKILRVGVAEMLTPAQQLDDPYYLYLSNYIRQGCLDRKYACIPLESRGDSFQLSEPAELDGIVAIGLFTPQQIEALAALSSNLVFLDSSPYEARFDSVVLNYALGIRLALDHLKALGHRRIGYVGPVSKFNDFREPAPEVRWNLFRDMQAESGMLLPELMLDCPMQTDAAARMVAAFLERGIMPPTAFLCANEEAAIGTLRALRAHGLQVPQDVSVVSFNDTPRSGLVDPPLTSISAHVEEMANASLRLLSERATLGDRPPVRKLPLKLVVPPALVIRESSSAAADCEIPHI